LCRPEASTNQLAVTVLPSRVVTTQWSSTRVQSFTATPSKTSAPQSRACCRRMWSNSARLTCIAQRGTPSISTLAWSKNVTLGPSSSQLKIPPNFLTQQSEASTFSSAPLSSRTGISGWANDSPMCSRGKCSFSSTATRRSVPRVSRAASVLPPGPPPAITTS
jgi:hypothetical protein